MIQKHITLTIILSFISFLILCALPRITVSQVETEEIVIGEKVKIHSDVLEEDRTLLIRLPKDYGKSKQKYPVLYLLDAEFFFQQASAAVQFLSENGYIRNQPIPQMIIVGIVNVDRNRDYTPTYAPEQPGNLRFPTSGKADTFLEFLDTELFPFVESNYQTQPYRILSGWSLGGLLTVYTYLEHSHLFSAYLAVSPSLWWDNDLFVGRIDSYLNQGKISDKPFVVTIGSLEGSNIGRTVRDGLIALMKKKLDKKKPFTSVEIPDEGHSYVPYKAFFDGLSSLYSDWMMPVEVLSEGLQAIESFYKNLSQKYGYEVNIPESAYLGLANTLFSQGERKKALETAKLCTQKYPESSYAHYRLGRLHHQIGDFVSARSSYLQALELEKVTSDPDSERIIMYTINLQDVEKEINRKKE